MKKAFVYLLFFSGLISLFSCEDTDYQIYDKNQKDKLFFTEDSVQFTGLPPHGSFNILVAKQDYTLFNIRRHVIFIFHQTQRQHILFVLFKL